MSDSTATPEADAAPPVAGAQTGGPSEAPAPPSTQGELGKALGPFGLLSRKLLEDRNRAVRATGEVECEPVYALKVFREFRRKALRALVDFDGPVSLVHIC